MLHLNIFVHIGKFIDSAKKNWLKRMNGRKELSQNVIES
jgi:hypothetical protein